MEPSRLHAARRRPPPPQPAALSVRAIGMLQPDIWGGVAAWCLILTEGAAELPRVLRLHAPTWNVAGIAGQPFPVEIAVDQTTRQIAIRTIYGPLWSFCPSR